MAKPPINPLTYNDKKISYFEFLAREVKPYLDEMGINLSFKGYNATIQEYCNINNKDIDALWRLSNDLNVWSEYLSDISNLIQKLLLDSETEKIKTICIASYNADNKKVANGDRLANKDESVIKIRKKRNALKAFYSELESKIIFLDRAYHHCKATCDWYYKSLTINKAING